MNETRKSSRLSLRVSLGLAFLGIVILTALLLGVANYFNVRTYVRNDIREKMRGAVAVAALLVNASSHDSLQSAADESSPSYAQLTEVLRAVRDRNPDARYVYTFRRDDAGKVVFVGDAEEDPDERSHVGDVYPDTTATLMAAFDPPYAVQVESEFATDKWGTWMSAFAPILRADGSLAGVLGMDVSAAQVLAYERKFVLITLGLSFGVCIVVMGLGLFFARSISRPLTSLAQDMSRIQTLDLDAKIEFKSRIVEVANMGTALDNMKKGLRSFRKYVPSELVGELIAMRKEAVLGVERRQLTVFFSDIADFTTISEQLGVEKLSEVLGEYFHIMTKTILVEHGTIDKFIGDAVMAFWNAPRALEQHAAFACRAALNCQRELDLAEEQWARRGLPALRTRIGLNSGEAVVGNTGFSERLSYTALGDSVNLASRLEALNKFYGTRIIMSAATHELVKDVMVARPIDNVVVKGKTQGVMVYELLGEKGAVTPEISRLADQATTAIDLYLRRRWGPAGEIYQSMIKQNPQDQAARVLAERCAKLEAEPPSDDWTGAIYLREK